VVSRTPGRFRLLTTHQITNGAMVDVTDDEVVGSYFGYTSRLVEETLARVGWAASEVDWVVPQNTNPKAWQILVRLLGLHDARIHQATLSRVAHVISGDNIVNLADLIASGDCSAGDRLLLVMAGYGMNWQATALEAC
jgi:3-oxoacyl-[acyl-carrier-protein] synthase-3